MVGLCGRRAPEGETSHVVGRMWTDPHTAVWGIRTEVTMNRKASDISATNLEDLSQVGTHNR